MVPLMQLRLEGASDCFAATNRGGCYRKRTASLSSETVAREMKLACVHVSLHSPLSRGAPRTTIQEESPFYKTRVPSQMQILRVNSGYKNFRNPYPHRASP